MEEIIGQVLRNHIGKRLIQQVSVFDDSLNKIVIIRYHRPQGGLHEAKAEIARLIETLQPRIRGFALRIYQTEPKVVRGRVEHVNYLSVELTSEHVDYCQLVDSAIFFDDQMIDMRQH